MTKDQAQASDTAEHAETDAQHAGEERLPLFRQEVLDGKRNRWMGSILFDPRLSPLGLLSAALGLSVAMVLFFIFGSYSQSVTLNGQLQTSAANPAALEAHFLAPGSDVGLIAPGQSVALRFNGFPHERFGVYRGEVLAVSRTDLTTASPGAAVTQTDGSELLGEALFRVAVSLPRTTVEGNGRTYELLDGLGVEGDILVERRRLYQWLLGPVLQQTRGPRT